MTKNIAASVRARLSNEARRSSRPFQEVLQYYGLERFLYRFSRSRYRDCFVLKGALMLRVWDAPEARPTRDIDFLGHVDNSIQTLERITREVCDTEVEDDGMIFSASTVAGQRIGEDAEYEGVRVTFVGALENARIRMQLDVGFGDVVHPPAQDSEYPTILSFPTPRLRTYPRETVVAEKFQAMVYLGRLNSRMKDFFDIWLLARQFDFVGSSLAEAVARTFENRGTNIDPDPFALTAAFCGTESVQRQWTAFVNRTNLESAPRTLEEIREPLRQFLLPVVAALVSGQRFTQHWTAPGPWRAEQGRTS